MPGQLLAAIWKAPFGFLKHTKWRNVLLVGFAIPTTAGKIVAHNFHLPRHDSPLHDLPRHLCRVIDNNQL